VNDDGRPTCVVAIPGTRIRVLISSQQKLTGEVTRVIAAARFPRRSPRIAAEEWRKRGAQKRRSGQPFLEIDALTAEQRFALENAVGPVALEKLPKRKSVSQGGAR